MKIVSKNFTPFGSLSIKMVPEEEEDLWVLYNLIEDGDIVLSHTTRKVVRETDSGKTVPKKVGLKLQIKVEAVEYKQDSALRVRGINILQNEHVEIGVHHTLEIKLRGLVELEKEEWDKFELKALLQASDPAASADLAVVLMQEGLAEIFLVGNSITKSCSRISTSIPRKHGLAMGAYDKALNKFFTNVIDAFLKHIDFKVVRCAVIASPGFTKDQFHSQLLLEAERKQIKQILENKSRIILAHTSSGYKHSLREVLEAPNIMKMIKGTKAATEVQALQDFYAMFSKDPNRACYGPKHVELAHEQKAIQTLLITDEVFRNSDIPTRHKYEDLVESVNGSGGTAYVFSSLNASGEQLAMLTGIAAILRFPLPDLDDIEM